VFDLDQTSRLKVWKEFRQSLETSEHPLEDVALFWSRTPFVHRYLDPNYSSDWPDPWHLIIDNSMFSGEERYIVVVNDRDVLNFFHREVTNTGELTHGSNKIYPV